MKSDAIFEVSDLLYVQFSQLTVKSTIPFPLKHEILVLESTSRLDQESDGIFEINNIKTCSYETLFNFSSQVHSAAPSFTDARFIISEPNTRPY